ncbi:MAG: hypothetical protein ACYDBQ_01270 [Thermoplasmatota archaeon]
MAARSARVFLCVAAMIPGALAQADQQPTAYSDATYPQEWRLVNDYWFNATTFLGDERSFTVRMTMPSAGDYVWAMLETGGVNLTLPNPLAHLFSTFTLEQHGAGAAWDLARANLTPAFHADGVHDLFFTVTYRIAHLSPYEYTSIIDQTIQVRDAERRLWPNGNIVTHPNEASGFIRLEQVSRDASPGSCSGTCAGMTQLIARDFDLVFNLVGHPFQLTFQQAAHVDVSPAENQTYLAAGSSYTANAAFQATITTSGDLIGNATAALLDDPAQPSATIALDARQPTTQATFPAGNHRLYYRIDDPDGAAVEGAVAVTSPRATSSIQDAIRIQPSPPQDYTWAWVLPIAGAVGLALALAQRRRFTWYEYQPGTLYLVVDRLGRKPDREHHGRPPLLARIRPPRQLR